MGNSKRKNPMSIWSRFMAILTFPGDFLVSRLPKMDAETTRLTTHMTNYIFCLTPSLGILLWLVIRNAASII
jgi:hypothetical protein